MNANGKHTLMAVFAYGTLVMALVFVIAIGWMKLYPYKTIDVHSVTIVDTTVPQGGTLTFYLDYDRFTDADSTVHRIFEDGLVFNTPLEERTGEIGHFKRFVEVPIPQTLPPGVYSLRTISVHHVNPIRDIKTEFTTTTFTVTPSKNIDLDK